MKVNTNVIVTFMVDEKLSKSEYILYLELVSYFALKTSKKNFIHLIFVMPFPCENRNLTLASTLNRVAENITI